MRLLNNNELRWWCETSTSKIFRRIGHVCETPIGRFSYLDRGANVLAVAHLDTALECQSFNMTRDVVYSPALDDRLGAYAITSLFPRQGVVMDVLLTEGEETMESTAQFFEPKKQYNWIVSFDRAGTDVVMYQYKDKEMEKLLQTYDLGPAGLGSFSDICWLDHLGCKAFNIGIGYDGQHSLLCHANLKDTRAQLWKFGKMWQSLKDILLPHVTELPLWYDDWTVDDVIVEWEGHLFLAETKDEEFYIRCMIDALEGGAVEDEIWEYYVGESELNA